MPAYSGKLNANTRKPYQYTENGFWRNSHSLNVKNRRKRRTAKKSRKVNR
jgi:hypothetical protein